MRSWDRLELANEIAREHVDWAKRSGYQPADFFEALQAPFILGWDDVHFALGAAWLLMR